MRTITVANMKGGSSKTTTAAYLAHALARGGRRVACVDADPAGSLMRWREAGDWQLPVLGMPSRKLHLDLPNIADRYDVVVIDTPPLEEDRAKPGIVRSAVRAATDVVIPVAPTAMELDRLSPILYTIEDVGPDVDAAPVVRVLLTRTVSRASSVEIARDVITADLGQQVFATVVPRLERYALAFGGPVDIPPGDPYGLVAAELEQTEAVQA